MTQLKSFGKESNQIKCTHYKLLGKNNEKIKEVDRVILIKCFLSLIVIVVF